MKHLSDYINTATNMALENAGAFWAFGQSQFDEQKKPGVVYVNCGAGLVCPKANAGELLKRLKRIGSAAIKRDLKENGAQKIILRELSNHECGYTGDISPVVANLADYGITEDEIKTVYREHRHEIA